MATGKTVELTGKNEARREQALAQLTGGVHPMIGDAYIESPTRGRTQEITTYAIIKDGVPVFASWVRHNSIISLSFRSHWLQVNWTQMENRPITFETPLRSSLSPGARSASRRTGPAGHA